VDSIWSPAQVLRDWIRSLGKVSILMDSIRSLSGGYIPGAHQDSMMVHCYLKRGPDGLQEDSRWTPDTVSEVYLDS
jgi:hypothetical protein